MNDIRIAIVGAGIGGITLAIALLRRGLRPTIYERAPELGEVGAGITLWPNATKALFSLGLKDALDSISEDTVTQSMWHFQTGEMFREYPRGQTTRAKYGGPLYQIHRRDLHDVLTAAVPKELIKLGQAVTDVIQTDKLATLTLGDGAKVEADIVVACDGIRSTVRERVWGKEPARFTGVVAYRGMVPMDKVPKPLHERPARMHIGPARNVTHYTVRHGTVMNYLCFAKVDQWTDEGWRIRATVPEVLGLFSAYHEDVLDLIRATPPDTLFKWGLFDRDPIANWVKGCIALLGDAAHPMLPFLGQGAGMVIEDAVIMARAVAESDDVATALKRYEDARRDRANFTLMRSRLHTEFWSSHPDQIRDKEPVMEIDLQEYEAATVPI